MTSFRTENKKTVSLAEGCGCRRAGVRGRGGANSGAGQTEFSFNHFFSFHSNSRPWSTGRGLVDHLLTLACSPYIFRTYSGELRHVTAAFVSVEWSHRHQIMTGNSAAWFPATQHLNFMSAEQQSRHYLRSIMLMNGGACQITWFDKQYNPLVT